jgi:hypothetical protein
MLRFAGAAVDADAAGLAAHVLSRDILLWHTGNPRLDLTNVDCGGLQADTRTLALLKDRGALRVQ